MNDTTHLRMSEDPGITDEAVDREVLGPIARRIANNRAGSLGAWLESHLWQYTDAVQALGDRSAS